jgi:MerR family transcriptional regulator, light-induced transcriptional regulator
MKSFSIYELERLSGIKMGTIRIWEKRYKMLQPQRTMGNIRLYPLNEVQHFLNVAFLNKKGYKISKISKLDAAAILQHVSHFRDDESQQEHTIDQLFYFMFSLEIESFEEILDFAVYSWGIDETIEKIMIPFLEKVDVLSYQDSSSEVHFVVTALRKKLILGIEKVPPAQKVEQKALLFLPKGEHYDLVLLYLTYVLKRRGLQVLYLGTNISNENIHQVVQVKKPNFLVTYFSLNFSAKIQNLVSFLNQHLPKVTLFVAKSESVHLPIKSGNLQELYFKEAAMVLGS